MTKKNPPNLAQNSQKKKTPTNDLYPVYSLT